MTNPTTPTGKRIWNDPIPDDERIRHAYLLAVGEIPAIEREAAAAERERLLTKAMDDHSSRHDGLFTVCEMASCIAFSWLLTPEAPSDD